MKQYGFSKKERLLKSFQFNLVYKEGKVNKGEIFWIYFKKNFLAYNRMGISLKKKFFKNIVSRNKAKRMLRQLYQLNKDNFGNGKDIIFVIKKKPEKIQYQYFKKKIFG